MSVTDSSSSAANVWSLGSGAKTKSWVWAGKIPLEAETGRLEHAGNYLHRGFYIHPKSHDMELKTRNMSTCLYSTGEVYLSIQTSVLRVLSWSYMQHLLEGFQQRAAIATSHWKRKSFNNIRHLNRQDKNKKTQVP